MVGLPFDCLANPLGAVRLTFEKAISLGNLDPSTSDGRDWGALDVFRRFLFEDGGLSQVPMLNPANSRYIRPKTLVQFRGMIQDMLGNEFYVGSYKDGSTWRTNKYMDSTLSEMDMSCEMRLWERGLVYAIPVPGLNYWAEASQPVAIMNQVLEQREKRYLEENEAMESMELVPSEIEGSPSCKKIREELGSSSAGQHDSFIKDTYNFSKTPVSTGNSFPCLVKIYDSQESDLKLNDVFEFVGVLSFDSDIAVEKNDFEEHLDGLLEDELVQLPPSKVPRIHCLVHRKLEVHDFLPSKPALEPDPSVFIRGIRQSLLGHLTSILGNDVVAAQFLLLHLLSQVQTRVDTVAVGKLSLNLTCFGKESASVFSHRLSNALKDLLPFTHYVPLTVEYLNTSSLAPKKDYRTNRLVSGVLQLAKGSHLTIDETHLQSGSLDAEGIHNAGLLKNLIQLQKVEYDFQYYKMEMAADVQILVLSEGKSNILPADLILPFQPSFTGSLEAVSAELLHDWRWYLVTLRSLPHSFSPEVQKIVEDLVAARQADRSINIEDFSRLLTMARLMCLSYGETCLSTEHWESVKELERLRKERIK